MLTERQMVFCGSKQEQSGSPEDRKDRGVVCLGVVWRGPLLPCGETVSTVVYLPGIFGVRSQACLTWSSFSPAGENSAICGPLWVLS